MRCYVHWNGGAWFVKEEGFFISQKNDSIRRGEAHPWWEAWRLLPEFVDGFEHARLLAKTTWGVKGERWK